MKRLRRLPFIAGLACVAGMAPASLSAQEPVWQLKSLTEESTSEYSLDTRTLTADHGAMVTYQDESGAEVVLTANRITINEATGLAVAEGKVYLQRDNQVWTGERLEYNFLTREIKSGPFRTGMTPFFASGEGLTLNLNDQTYTATNSYTTTDDVADPAFKVRAKSITLAPGRYIEARNAVVHAGRVPVMYFPYYKRNLTRHPNNFVFTPGYRSLYGPFLLSEFNWYYSEDLRGTIHLDYRQKRGVGAGPDLFYDADKLGAGGFKYYYTHDEDPPDDPNTGETIRDHRYRISFDHHVTLRTNLTAMAVVRKQSDPYIIRDFFENEYRRNVQPSSFVDVKQLWPNFSLDILAQPQLNDFFETVERLPDVRLTAFRQQLGISPFYYESESSAGYFRYKFANDAQPDYAAFRGDTYHQVLWPKNFFGWLNVTPRVGGRFTYYSETEGFGSTLTEQERAVFNTGVDVSTKLSRVYPGARSRLLEVKELRHIIEPTVSYVYVPSPSVSPRELPQFDRELPSYRLLPLHYPDYNAIDSVDSQNVLRMGLRNKLQTKREDGVDYLLDWSLYTDWRIKPRRDQTTFADFYSDLDFKPRSWIVLTSETRYNIEDGRWRMADHYATIQPKSNWSLSLGHRYLDDEPALGPSYARGHNLIMSRFTYRFNENWAARAAHHFETRDGVLEEQYYTLYRDMRSWTAALSFRLRDNRVGPDDFSVILTFSLKAFPRYKLGSDADTPAPLIGS